jgi:hypothetical protein
MRFSSWLFAPLLLSAACADLAADSPSLGGQASALTCDGLSVWSARPFSLGERVQHRGRAFECKVPGWCQQAVYEPLGSLEHPTAWLEAWTEVSSCEGASACEEPVPYALGQRYAEGARVEREGKVYACKPWPYSGHCGQAGYEPGTGQAWQDAWTTASPCPHEPAAPKLTVIAYYLRPSDLPYRQEYYDAMVKAMSEAQAWYLQKLGVTFDVEYRTAVGVDHLTMRCGPEPTEKCASDVSLTPYYWNAMVEATGGWHELESKFVFAQGAGEYGITNLIQRYAGISMVGDWVLEPISGVREPKAAHCGTGMGWLFCPWAQGLVANQLGHLFGALRPVGIDNPATIMDFWGDYPNTDFLPHERKLLALSPNLTEGAYDLGGPFLYLEFDDIVTQGSLVDLPGQNLEGVTLVEFVDAEQTLLVEPLAVAADYVRVQVPAHVGLGYVRVHSANQVSNALGVDFVPAQ